MCYSPLVQICRYFIRSCAELIWHYLFKERASLVAQMVKNLPAMQETWVQSLGQEKPPEKGMATHSNILAWGIPWTEEPDGLQSMGLQRIGHNWVTNTHISGKEPQFCWYSPFLNINFFWLHHTACEILVPWLGMEPMASALEAPSLNHRSTQLITLYIMLRLAVGSWEQLCQLADS